MADVFVSYASQDRNKAKELVGALEAQGLSVWWDRHLHPGTFFTRVIEHELKQARAIVTLWSPSAVASDWVVGEATVAHRRGVIIPILLEECEVPPPFNTLHMLTSPVASAMQGDGGGSEALEDLLGRVREVVASTEVAEVADAPAEIAPAQPVAKPLVAVLPFDAHPASLADLAEAVASEVLSALNQFSTLEVVPRRTSFAPDLDGCALSEVARQLEADYVITGQLASPADKVRLMVELVDGAKGKQLFSTTSESTLDNLARKSVEIASTLARKLGGEFLRLEIIDAQVRPNYQVDVWTLLNRARSHFVSYGAAHLRRSLDFVDEALALAPHEPYAHAIKASILSEMLINAMALDGGDAAALARTSLDAALASGSQDPVVMKYCGGVLSYLGEQDKAVRLLRRSVEINPFDLGTWGFLAGALINLDPRHVEEAFAILDMIQQASPRHPGIGFWHLHRAVGCTVLENYPEAVAAAQDAVTAQPGLTFAWWTMANALGQLDQDAAAREASARALEQNPLLDAGQFVARFVALAAQEPDRRRRSAGLVRAGLLER